MSLLNNKTFYPTPKKLADKMIWKINGNPVKILEPSAGKGDLIEYFNNRHKYDHHRLDISAIEIDHDLQATLRGKKIKVIDSDFLAFAGADKFDLIIANPPFDDGDKHLLKAIDILYRGQIVFLLNAETLKNPYSNTRKELASKLAKLNADIEYIPNAFLDAERKTGVEVALISIVIERAVENDLFAGANDKASHISPEIEENNELTTRRAVEDLVAEYNQVVQIGIDTIVGYFRNYRKIGKYIGINEEADKNYSSRSEDMTGKMQVQVNHLLKVIRKDFWMRTLDLKDVSSRLTSKKREEFDHQVNQRCDMDFTAANIRQFILNLMAGHEKTLTEAVLDVFDKFTIENSYTGGLYNDNIHLFNGWKTNNAFKVGKRVIIPVRASYGNPWVGYSGWKLDYKASEQLRDIDLVMNYFDGMESYLSLNKAIDDAFSRNQSSSIKSTYFTATVYKKGTIHLRFNDENILRRFNLAACMGKQWLPHDYGRKTYEEMPVEEKQVVESFEGVKSYSKNINRPVFAERANTLQLSS